MHVLHKRRIWFPGTSKKFAFFFCDTCPLTSKKKTLNDMMTTQPSSSADTQDKYKNSNTSKLFDQELRFSSLPELKLQKKELNKENGEKRKLIFEHEDNMICEVANYLGIDKIEISGFHRLGKFDAASTLTRQKLVKFKNRYNVKKLLVRASMLKNYDPEYACEKYKVYLSKSLNREQQLHEKKLLKKRRELINQENCGPKQINIRSGILYLIRKPVELTAWLPNLYREST